MTSHYAQWAQQIIMLNGLSERESERERERQRQRERERERESLQSAYKTHTQTT